MTKTNAVFTECTVFGRRRQIILRIFVAGVRPLALLLTFACLSASMMFAQNCAPPSAFVDAPHPAIDAPERLVSHTEEIVINRSLPIVLSAVDKPIKDTIHKSGSLPGVSGEYLLTKAEFGRLGSRRINCLSDGDAGRGSLAERTRREIVSFSLHRVELYDREGSPNLIWYR